MPKGYGANQKKYTNEKHKTSSSIPSSNKKARDEAVELELQKMRERMKLQNES